MVGNGGRGSHHLSLVIRHANFLTKSRPARVERRRPVTFVPAQRNLLLSACDGGRVTLWNWIEGVTTHTWRLEQPLICSLAVSPDGTLVAAGASDDTAIIYDLVPENP